MTSRQHFRRAGWAVDRSEADQTRLYGSLDQYTLYIGPPYDSDLSDATCAPGASGLVEVIISDHPGD